MRQSKGAAIISIAEISMSLCTEDVKRFDLQLFYPLKIRKESVTPPIISIRLRENFSQLGGHFDRRSWGSSSDIWAFRRSFYFANNSYIWIQYAVLGFIATTKETI